MLSLILNARIEQVAGLSGQAVKSHLRRTATRKRCKEVTCWLPWAARQIQTESGSSLREWN